MNNLTNVITKPTRVTTHSSTLLDPILVSNFINVTYADTLDIESIISDHKATLVLFRFDSTPLICLKRKVWFYNRADFIELNQMINVKNWNTLLSSDINEACEYFTSTLVEMMSVCIPSKEVTVRPNDRPWYDSEIRRLSRQRDRLKKIMTNRGQTSDWLRYKNIRNKVNNLKTHAKQRYFSNLDETISNSRISDPKKYWKYLRSLVK